MAASCEIFAELTLDERAPERSGCRLIEWARICGARGVVLPRRPWISEQLAGTLCRDAAAKGLRAYRERSFQQGVRVIEEAAGDRRLAIGVNPDKSLGAWLHLRQEYGRALGYTDGWPHPWSALNAALAHAPVVMKGLTLSRTLGGPDHRGSLYPDEFGALVDHVQWALAHVAAKPERVRRGEPQQDNSPVVNTHLSDTDALVARVALPKDHQVQPDDLKALRGLRGLSVGMTAHILGRRLLSPCQPDEPLTFGMIEPLPGSSGGVPLDISVVIRTKNEAEWLTHTLSALRWQQRPPQEIIVVDNESTDQTKEIARAFDCQVVSISDREFTYGKALNLGFEAASRPWVVSLSAHCIPVHDLWLEAFAQETGSSFVAGVYGRQEPLSTTHPVDKRDLWTTFGEEPRIQRGRDYFFHNANSLIRRSLWERMPFDETLDGVEDRDWAKKIQAEGYLIVYAPLASVHHYHGIHQGRDEARAKRVVKVIELIQQREPVGALTR